MNIQNLSRYLFEIENALIPELKNELTSDYKKEFKEWKKSIGTDNYWKWYIENIDEIRQYTSSTPAQRNKLKKWNTSTLVKARMIIASIHFLQKAEIFLDTYQFNLYQYQETSYRKLAANAGEAYFIIQNKKCKLFLC
ncbi:MAG: hypothetical protein AB7U51_04430 [Arcobacter sp.]|uniref:hypothetical protein n=1 Tax=Arcobacter sp. TaxID=1872629 RepID=UPI003D064C23